MRYLIVAELIDQSDFGWRRQDQNKVKLNFLNVTFF